MHIFFSIIIDHRFHLYSPGIWCVNTGRFHLQLSDKKNTDNRIKNYIWKKHWVYV